MKKSTFIALALSVSVSMPAMAMDKDHHRTGHNDKLEHYFGKMDKNRDGVVNWSEHKSFSYQMFNEADANNDKMVSREEMHQHVRRHHEKEYGSYDRRDEGDYRDQPRRGDRYERMSPSAGEAYYPMYNHRPQSGSRNDRVYGNSNDTVAYWDTSYPDQRYPSERYNDKNY